MMPITPTFQEYWQLVFIVAGFGAVGGLAYELLQNRLGNTGVFELPGKRSGGIFDLGWIASLIIGAITALALLYVFPPVTEITVGQSEAAGVTPKTYYDIVKVIALSVIAGSAGPAFLTGLQARVLAVVNAQKVETVKEVSKKQIEAIDKKASQEVADKVKLAIEKQKETIAALLNQASSTVPPDLFKVLQPQLANNVYTVANQQVTVSPPPPTGNLQLQLNKAMDEIGRAALETSKTESDARIGPALETIDAAAWTKPL